MSAKNWFTGPKHTIDLPEGVTSADEIELEHHGKTAHGGKPHDWKPGDPLRGVTTRREATSSSCSTASPSSPGRGVA